MAFFASGVLNKEIFGRQRVNTGTFTQVSGDTGGVFNTGLTAISYFTCTADIISISISGGAVTVVTKDPAANQNGYWEARGR
jgi:hypothetical protein